MTLTEEQKLVVENNMGLVGKVLKDKLHGGNAMAYYSHEDLFQIGCIGLCKAAATDKGIGCFSTYAYRLIWNEICDALILANKRVASEAEMDDDLMTPDCVVVVGRTADCAGCHGGGGFQIDGGVLCGDEFNV